MRIHFPRPTCLFLLLSCLVVFSSCDDRDKKEEIKQALANYDRLIKKMDADSIAQMYTADGDLGDIAHGRDSIKKFLSTFVNVKVLSVHSSSEKIEIKEDTAIQNGRYDRVAVVNSKDTVRPAGTFIAKWVWKINEGWNIQRMTTTPDNNSNK